METLSSPSHWLPEDDLLLKNSVEAGASLESLAKGAVQFSQRFSLHELRERWHSLLYDPICSYEAASRIAEFEHPSSTFPSKISKADNSRETESLSSRRKPMCVRRCYYALRKRIISERFNSMDLVFCNGHCPRDGDGPLSMKQPGKATSICSSFFPEKATITNGFSNTHENGHTQLGDENNDRDLSVNGILVSRCSKLDEDNVLMTSWANLDYSRSGVDVPEWRTDDCISTPCAPANPEACERDTMPPMEESFRDDIGSKIGAAGSMEEELGFRMNHTNPSTNSYLTELSNCLLNFTSDEELLLMDADEQDVIDNSYYNGLNSLLMSSYSNNNQDRLLNSNNCDVSVSLGDTEVMISPSREELPEHAGHCCEDVITESSLQIPTCSSTSRIELFEPSDGVICTLNTEDPEIPCNDDVVFPTDQSWGTVFDVLELYSSSNEMNNDHSAHHGVQISSHVRWNCKHSSRAPETKQPGVMCQGVPVPSQDPCVHKDDIIDCGKLNHHVRNFSKTSDVINQDAEFSLKTQRDNRLTRAEGGLLDHAVLEELANYQTLEAEDIFADSDSDIPHSSDIEAMILEMDLDPEGKDTHALDKVVSKYQNDIAMKAIVRLEQAALSYVQRAIVSHGAFAVLYGRFMKSYIQKAEVLLGRATEDSIVDIDLGREGRANKISRRQALICLERSGSFLLKNLGKCSIMVNDNELNPRHCLKLASGSLIQVRGLSFIFESSDACVKQYLDSVTFSDNVQKTTSSLNPQRN